jgi:adenylate cyclase
VATVLFLDMKGYTQQAEKLDPERLMDWVNDFMEPMADAVRRCGGVVDDYFGDGLKANFGAPLPAETEDEIARDACRAVDCAFEMASALEHLNARYRERSLPTVAMRIGIHTGVVVVGSLGSDERLKYTSVGEVVVTAQRLESLEGVDHDYERCPYRILISAQTLSRVSGRYESESLGHFSLKGMDEAVEVHRIVGRCA